MKQSTKLLILTLVTVVIVFALLYVIMKSEDKTVPEIAFIVVFLVYNILKTLIKKRG